MNNSEALRDDNGKLEARLRVAGVCGRLADSFLPGGTRKGLFIHIIYDNKTALLSKVSEHGRVTPNLAAAGRRSDDYGSAVPTFSPTAVEPKQSGGQSGGHFYFPTRQTLFTSPERLSVISGIGRGAAGATRRPTRLLLTQLFTPQMLRIDGEKLNSQTRRVQSLTFLSSLI